MTKSRQVTLVFSLLSTTFVTLCVNAVIFDITRSPLSVAGIVISAVGTTLSAILTVLTYRRI